MAPVDPLGQLDHRVRFDWGPMGLRRLARHVDSVVVVDVLSFTTCVDVALGRGATVHPYRWADDGEEGYAAEHDAVLAVPRSDVDGDHPVSLSPASLDRLTAGMRVVLPSPNGSALCFGAHDAGASTVVAACLRNAVSVGTSLATGGTVAVIAAGERWHGARGPMRAAFEDLVGAGAVLAQLPVDDLSPEARAAVGAFDGVAANLAAQLERCASGRQLVAEGYAEDVALASAYDASRLVPTLRDGAFAPE